MEELPIAQKAPASSRVRTEGTAGVSLHRQHKTTLERLGDNPVLMVGIIAHIVVIIIKKLNF